MLKELDDRDSVFFVGLEALLEGLGVRLPGHVGGTLKDVGLHEPRLHHLLARVKAEDRHRLLDLQLKGLGLLN